MDLGGRSLCVGCAAARAFPRRREAGATSLYARDKGRPIGSTFRKRGLSTIGGLTRSARCFPLYSESESMDGVELAEIRVDDPEGGYVDFNLTLASYQRHSDGSQHVSARGLYKGQIVGFCVVFGTAWEKQELKEGGISLYWGKATLISSGQESDDFLRAIEDGYKTGVGSPRMAAAASFTAVGLNHDPACMDRVPINVKLFSDSDDEALDAEFFLNVDIRNLQVQFREKDTDYRRGVVLFLSARASQD